MASKSRIAAVGGRYGLRSCRSGCVRAMQRSSAAALRAGGRLAKTLNGNESAPTAPKANIDSRRLPSSARGQGPGEDPESFHSRSRRGRILRVSYESLVTDPQPIMVKVCQHVRLPYEKTMLRPGRCSPPSYSKHQYSFVDKPLKPARIDCWQHKLSPRQVDHFELIAGQVLEMQGYSLQGLSRARPSRLRNVWCELLDAGVALKSRLLRRMKVSK